MTHNNGSSTWFSGSSPTRHDINDSNHALQVDEINDIHKESRAKRPRLSFDLFDGGGGDILGDGPGDQSGTAMDPDNAGPTIDLTSVPWELFENCNHVTFSFPNTESIDNHGLPPPIEQVEPEVNRKLSFHEMQGPSPAAAEMNPVEPDRNPSHFPFAASLSLALSFPQAAYLQESKAVLQTWMAMYFGWLSHPCYKTYLAMVKVFSGDWDNYPKWTNSIVDQVIARLQVEAGIHQWFICVEEHNDEPLIKGIFDTRGGFLGQWRLATLEEIAKRIKQRFADDRKPNNRGAAAAVVVRPGPAPLFVSFANREPWPRPLTTKSVCFEWIHCDGIVRCCEVVRMFATNLAEYPQWNVSIVDQVKASLATEDITDFLVFLNKDTGRPCLSIRKGRWYEASNDEVVKHIHKLFVEERRRSFAFLENL